jgi:hypothetical protein
MSLVYLIGSLAGIALLVALNHVLLGRAALRFESVEAVAARLARELPGFRPGMCDLDARGRAALMENAANGAAWLVAAHGDGAVLRKLTPSLLERIDRDGAKLFFRLRDFTLPSACVALARDADAERWLLRLSP